MKPRSAGHFYVGASEDMFHRDKQTLLRAISGLLLLVASGCASYEPDAELGTEAYRQSLRVIVQICLPYKLTRHRLRISEVNRYGPQGELRSVGSSTVESSLTSMDDQTIFEKYTGDRHSDLIAFIVNLDEMAYTFDIAKAKPELDRWSDWEAPLSQNHEREMVWHKLANQRDFNVNRPSDFVPKARYRLVRTIDWWNKVPRQNDDRPGCFRSGPNPALQGTLRDKAAQRP